MTPDDAELLRRYCQSADQAAFTELVGRHVGMVYAAALRQTRGNPHRAQEVAHMVFIALARKAATLARHPALPAWLHRSTRLAAAELGRKEARRAVHERAAPPPDMQPESDWGEVRPLLDAAIEELGERDRTAVILRFFSGQSYAAIGRALSLSENAARMRVERALEKLRARLARRGLTSSAAALSAGLIAESATAASLAPAALTAAIAASAGPAAATASAAGLVVFMSTNKLALAAAALVAATGSTLAVRQHQTALLLEAQAARLQASSAAADAARSEHLRLVAETAEAERLQAALQNQRSLSLRLQALQEDIGHLRGQIAAQSRARARDKASPGPVYDAGALDQEPSPTFQTPPRYPAAARLAGESGQAVVDLVVDQGGFVRNAYVVSSTDSQFEQPSLDAVQQWTFAPGVKGGQNVNVHLQVPIVYSLNPGGPPSASSSPTDWFPSKS